MNGVFKILGAGGGVLPSLQKHIILVWQIHAQPTIMLHCNTAHYAFKIEMPG